MALPSPSPLSLPLLSLTYITTQHRVIHASRAAARLGTHGLRPSSFGRGPPKNICGGLFHTPAQNTYVGAPSLPYPTNSLTLRSPKPNYGQLTSKGPTLGGCFLHALILGHWASDPKSKDIGGAILGTPHFGPLGVTCPFLQFWTPEHQRTTWITLTRSDTQLITRKPTHLGANLN